MGRETEVNCNARSLSHVGGKLFFLRGVGGWETSLAKQPTSSPAALDSISLSLGSLENLVPRTAAGAHSILCKVRSYFAPTKSNTNKLFL